jgi:hypothetical protein
MTMAALRTGETQERTPSGGPPPADLDGAGLEVLDRAECLGLLARVASPE